MWGRLVFVFIFILFFYYLNIVLILDYIKVYIYPNLNYDIITLTPYSRVEFKEWREREGTGEKVYVDRVPWVIWLE